MNNRLFYSVMVGTILVLVGIRAGESEQIKMNFWKGNTFHQQTVDTSKYNQGIIRAKTYGKEHKWEEYKISELPDEFAEWNFKSRIELLEKIFAEWNFKSRIELLEKIKKNKFPSFAGPHNAMVATQGIRRFDSKFSINNAVKGMGFLPKKEKMKEIIELLRSTINRNQNDKIDILINLYNKSTDMFDRTKQISLELYSTPEFETHSFLNQMVNPRTAIVFLDIPCFELKVIAQLLHPEDSELTEYEKAMVEYVNLIHSYFHGKFDKKFIATVYHIIEVYNNSPGKNGRGVRMVPENNY
jgi:hypothetical protein